MPADAHRQMMSGNGREECRIEIRVGSERTHLLRASGRSPGTAAMRQAELAAFPSGTERMDEPAEF